jgi:hypothetical protein
MKSWNPGDRVRHATYGTGTIIEFTDQHAVIHFDDHGRRKFASNLVVLTTAQQAPQPPVARRSQAVSERATDVGYENLNEQTVVRQTGLPGDRPGEKVHVLKCRRCGAEYGTKGCDIPLRRCPACMGGPPGLSYSASP